jgi:hypothetical protein
MTAWAICPFRANTQPETATIGLKTMTAVMSKPPGDVPGFVGSSSNSTGSTCRLPSVWNAATTTRAILNHLGTAKLVEG